MISCCSGPWWPGPTSSGSNRPPQANAPTSWMLDLFRRTRALRALSIPFAAFNRVISNLHIAPPRQWKLAPAKPRRAVPHRRCDLACLYRRRHRLCRLEGLSHISRRRLGLSDVFNAVGYGLLTLARVIVLIALATLIWVPVGVWIGLRPKLAERIQPLAQFLAAFPANLAFPVFVVVIVRYGLNAECLAQPADDPGHPVVHPVQRHRRRQRVSDRSCAKPPAAST